MGLRLVGAVSVTLLLLLVLAVLRLAVLLVQIVTLRYTLAIGAVALTCSFVDSRRRCYAKGFYSCSRVPEREQTEDKVERVSEDDNEVWVEGQNQSVMAAVPLETLDIVSDQPQKMVMAPPSETESEDDESECAKVVSVNETPVSAFFRHSMSFLDVRTRSNTTESDHQWEKATRPRSSSAAGDSRSIIKGKYCSDAVAVERKRRVPRRRADTGTKRPTKQVNRSRRATFASKLDAHATLSKSNSEKLEDALRSDGYWIGDFRVQRRLVSRRNHANNPKTILCAGERR